MEKVLDSVNPRKSYFVVYYKDGRIIKGKDLYSHGWEDVLDGFVKLEYVLSTGNTIEIPKAKAYLPIVETSAGKGGIINFHSITVNCLKEDELLVHRIILSQTAGSPLVGEVIVGREDVPKKLEGPWKYTG